MPWAAKRAQAVSEETEIAEAFRPFTILVIAQRIRVRITAIDAPDLCGKNGSSQDPGTNYWSSRQ